MGTETSSHPKASLGVTKDNAPGVINRATIMYAAILAAIATFTGTPISMPALLLLIQAAQTAQTAAASRAKGLAAVRNTKITPLWSAMLLLRTYVQGLVDQVDHAGGVALINQAGLVVGGVGTHVKMLFVAKLDTTANVVHLLLNAKAFIGPTGKRVTFHWQMSSDGKTWTSLPSHTAQPLNQTREPFAAPAMKYTSHICPRTANAATETTWHGKGPRARRASKLHRAPSGRSVDQRSMASSSWSAP
jgi:hypothetical protein